MRNRKPATDSRAAALRAGVLAVLAAWAAAPTARAAQPHDSGGGKVCATLKTFQGALQVFDSSRTHLGEASFGTKLRCGDWVAIETGRATIEHATEDAVLLVGENSFLQILDPQAGWNPERAHVALYRGEAVVQASARAEAGEIRVVTPNAIARIGRGGAFVVYSAAAEESQVVGLGGRATLENRFFGRSQVAASFARFVAFANPVERIVPEEPRWVHAREINDRLAKLGVELSLREGIEKAVKTGSKIRLPAGLAPAQPRIVVGDAAPRPFVAAQGADLPEASGGGAPAAGVSRGLAAADVRGSAATDSRGSAATTPKSDIASPGPTRPKIRAPRTARRPAAAEPDFALKRPETEARERVKLIQALSEIRADDE